ncbi:MAG: hypothetical protein JF614_28795 [Acidobacteria bacterium]|nr:hypothetical protein [Acidobacteriota bacterium]
MARLLLTRCRQRSRVTEKAQPEGGELTEHRQDAKPPAWTWLKRLLVALVALAALYLLAANLFLNTPLGPRVVNRRPERFRASWSSAWSLWPGDVRVRGLVLRGWTRNDAAWTVTVERGRGWIDVPALLGRRFVVSGFHGEGVRSSVSHGEGKGAPPEPEKPNERPRPPWGLRLDGIELAGVREVGYNDFRLTGDGRGRVAGSFSFVFGEAFRMDGSRLVMPASRLWMGKEALAQDLDVDATVSFSPFVPHEHPGLGGWDFLSGSLKAHGRVPGLLFLAETGLQGAGKPGRLVAGLQVDRGRLVPGSRAELVAGGAAGSPSAFALTADVAAGLRLGLEAQGLRAGRIPGRPPVFQCAAIAGTVQTPVVQLRRLFVTARELRTASNLSASPPLAGDLRLEGVRLDAPGSRANLRLAVDHAAGRIDLAAFVRQEVDIEGLQAEGISARLDLAGAKPAASTSPAPSWGVRIAGARLAGIREIGVDPFRLTGTSQLEATFSYDPAGNLDVQRAALTLPAGVLLLAGQPVAQGLSVKAEARVSPLVLGSSDLAFLRQVSGSAEVRARISSLGFLDPFLRKVPWLGLQGKGNLDAAVRLAAGRLVPGSRLAIRGARVGATLLDSLASGAGMVTVAVDPRGRTALRVDLDRFGFTDRLQPGRPDYIRGRNLRMAATTATPLDLAGALPDFDASLSLTGAEVPDLTVYDALLPEGAGFYILAGTGRVGLQLALSTATGRTRGTASLTSDTARVGFQDLDIQGRVALQAPFSSPDLQGRHFDLDGARLTLDRVSYRQAGDAAPSAPPGWWARARLGDAAVVWGQPLSLRAAGQVEMRDSGPLIALFAQRSRVVKWFDRVLSVEGIIAQGVLRIDRGVVAIDSFQATGGNLTVRSRMSFSKDRKQGDLLVRYGLLSAGVELLDGKRSFKLIRPQEWFERRAGIRP